jgi:hypothetical protein
MQIPSGGSKQHRKKNLPLLFPLAWAGIAQSVKQLSTGHTVRELILVVA